jgi:hypothetical protein
MWFFYTFAVVPIIIGAVLFYKNKAVVLWEWILGSVAALMFAGIMHLVAIVGMTSDIETWSGQVTKVSHHPRWVERYTKHHSETYYTGSGKNRTSHTRHWTTTEYDTHYEKWVAHRDFGTYDNTKIIEESEFIEISQKFGGKLYKDGKQSYNNFDGIHVSGDRNIYSIDNVNSYVIPVTITRSFENKIKAAPSLFSFAKVPETVKVFPWPDNEENWRQSNRLLGTSSVFIDPYKWDCLNSKLGPTKRVNLIMIGFLNEGIEYARWQEAHWIGGKKNDLVICYGGGTLKQKPKWAYVFGWTEKEIVKKNLESIILNNYINNDILPLIQSEVSKNYVIKDWSKFDYISIEPPTWSYIVFILGLTITQTLLYFYFHNNLESKNSYVRWKY